MNDGLIERWNSCIKPGDTVYHLGDFCLTKKVELIDGWLGRLNGTIRLVRGNHDQWVSRYERLKNKGKIKWIEHYAERIFQVNGEKVMIVMSHYPMVSWNKSFRGSIMLSGHCHGNLCEKNKTVRRMDVGVDCNDWYPVLLEDIVELMKGREDVDHHE